MGLCTGFSLLSGIEFVYFFSIRFWIDLIGRHNSKMRDNSGKKKNTQKKLTEQDHNPKMAWKIRHRQAKWSQK